MIVSRFSLAAAASVRLLLLFSLLLLSAAPARSTTATQATVATTLSSASITSPAVASATSLSAALPSPSYFSAPFGIPPQIVLDQPAIFNYTLPYTTQSPGLVLCQTNATDSDPISTANTWIVLLVPLSDDGQTSVEQANVWKSFPLTFQSVPGYNNLENLFFCWGIGSISPSVSFTCESYSPDFNVEGAPSQQHNAARGILGQRFASPDAREALLAARSIVMPATPLFISQSTQVLAISGVPSSSTPSTTSLPSQVTITTPGPTGTTVTVTPTPTSPSDSDSSSSSSSKSKSKLGAGPIAGIVIGCVVGLLLLLALLLLFCIRRRRRTPRGPHSDVLLAQSRNSSSRGELALEKTSPITTPTPTPGLTSSPGVFETRPSSGGPYDHLRQSAPYTGPAAPIARRPTTATILTTRTTSSSRGAPSISEISAPVSPRSTVRSEDDSTSVYRENQEIHNNNTPMIYGDARHRPQVYKGGAGTAALLSTTPFLSEPGMTPEEMARLEEEERRIDEAIAEAEAARR